MHPILFSLSIFVIKTKSVIVCLGIVISTAILLKSCQRNKISVDLIHENFLILIVSALLGSRLGFAIKNALTFHPASLPSQLLESLKIWTPNWSFSSGFLTLLAMLILLIYKKEKTDLIKWLDALTIPVLAMLFFVHIGNFFEGAAYGIPSKTPWAITIQNISVAYTVPIHPTQIYAAIYTAAIIFLLKTNPAILDKIMPRQPGRRVLLALTFHSFMSFLEQFLRGEETITIAGIRLAQILSLIIFLGSIYLIRKVKRINLNP